MVSSDGKEKRRIPCKKSEMKDVGACKAPMALVGFDRVSSVGGTRHRHGPGGARIIKRETEARRNAPFSKKGGGGSANQYFSLRSIVYATNTFSVGKTPKVEPHRIRELGPGNLDA